MFFKIYKLVLRGLMPCTFYVVDDDAPGGGEPDDDSAGFSIGDDGQDDFVNETDLPTGGEPGEPEPTTDDDNPDEGDHRPDDVTYLKSRLGKQGDEIGSLRAANRLMEKKLELLQQNIQSSAGGEPDESDEEFDPFDKSQFQTTTTNIVKNVLNEHDQQKENNAQQRRILEEANKLANDKGLTEQDIQIIAQWGDARGYSSLEQAAEELISSGLIKSTVEPAAPAPEPVVVDKTKTPVKKPGGHPKHGESGYNGTMTKEQAMKISNMSNEEIAANNITDADLESALRVLYR